MYDKNHAPSMFNYIMEFSRVSLLIVVTPVMATRFIRGEDWALSIMYMFFVALAFPSINVGRFAMSERQFDNSLNRISILFVVFRLISYALVLFLLRIGVIDTLAGSQILVVEFAMSTISEYYNKSCIMEESLPCALSVGIIAVMFAPDPWTIGLVCVVCSAALYVNTRYIGPKLGFK